MGDAIGRYLIFRGRVQGVGFRWTVRQTCDRFRIAGWVRNLQDGTVDAEFHGSPEDVSSAIEHLRRSRRKFIRTIEERDIQAARALSREFQIRQ